MFNVVHGDKVAVDALLDHPDVAAVSFVGSTPIAKYIHERATAQRQARAGARRREEPRDRDARRRPRLRRQPAHRRRLRLAPASAAWRSRVAVAVGDAADALVEKLRAKALDVKVGPGLDPDSEMGPLVTGAARDRVVDYIGRGEGDVVVDGRELEIEGDGFWVGPTLIDNVTTDMSVYTRRDLRPGARASCACDTLDEAIELINEQHLRQRHGDLHRPRATPRASSSAASRSA